MLLAEISQRFPLGSRFVSREDPARRVRVVESYHSVPADEPQRVGNTVFHRVGRQVSSQVIPPIDDEVLLVHERMGYWPSRCDLAPDMLAALFGLVEAAPIVPPSVVVQNVLAATPPHTAPWNEMQARIARDAEETRLRELLEARNRQTERDRQYQENVRVNRERQAEEERAVQEARRQLERTQRAERELARRAENEFINSQGEQLRRLANSLQELLAEAAQVLGKINEKLVPPTPEARSATNTVEEAERRLLIGEDEK